MEQLFLGLLVVVFLKSVLGYAYFDFYQFYKRGKEYTKAHSKWMLQKP